MAITKDRVREIFRPLEAGDMAGFFAHVADNVDWTVMGSHQLAGRYPSKAAFRHATIDRLAPLLADPLRLHVRHVFVDEDHAVVELAAEATAKNGLPFDNTYCWVCRFVAGQIVAVRAYLDSALVKRVVDENEEGPDSL